ncbi:MAG: hypothetical protein ACRBB6_04135 [Neptuniibacter sp.]
MPRNYKIGMRVNYRYLSFPKGMIVGVDHITQRVLLVTTHPKESFMRWVHWTSVEPNYRQIAAEQQAA